MTNALRRNLEENTLWAIIMAARRHASGLREGNLICRSIEHLAPPCTAARETRKSKDQSPALVNEETRTVK